MNKLNNKVGLVDISDKDLTVHFQKVTKEVAGLRNELEKIAKTFKGLKAQERLILLDVLVGAVIDMSTMSTFLAVSILEKYKNLILSGGTITRESSLEFSGEGPTNYIG